MKKDDAIDELNKGLLELKAKLVEDPLACLRVEVALLTFSDAVTLEVDFSSPETFNPPVLAAGGGTSLGAAIVTGLEMLASRCASYRAARLSHYIPWLILITDAASPDH